MASVSDASLSLPGRALAWYKGAFSRSFPEDTPQADPILRHLLPWGAAVLYLLMLRFLPGIVKSVNSNPKFAIKRDPEPSTCEDPVTGRRKTVVTPLSWIMFFWNMFLSILSLMMLIGLGIPFLGVNVFQRGFKNSVCNVEHDMAVYGTDIFWGMLFIYSKFFELLDTFFLIVKNPDKEIIFLHWFHHVATLVVTWYLNQFRVVVGFWSCVMNTIIHTLMYNYYAWMCFGIRMPYAFYLTIGQVVQMFAGIFFYSAYTYYHYIEGANCNHSGEESHLRIVVLAGWVMYAIYLWLFVKFFFQRWVWGKKAKSDSEGEGEEGSETEMSDCGVDDGEKEKVD